MNTQLKKEGEFEDGFKIGEWKTYYDNGQILSVGSYLDGMEEGVWKSFYRDGSIESEIMYKGGTRDGTYKKYHQNGVVNVDVRFSDGLYDSRYVELTSSQDTILTVDFREGSFNGRFVVDISLYNSEGEGSELFDLISTSVGTFYSVSFKKLSSHNLFEDGNFFLFEDDISSVSGFYKNGERDGRWVVKSVGKKSLELEYKNGVKDGELIKYFPLSETPQLKGSFNDGSKNGLWSIFYPNGDIKIEINLTDDIYDGFYKRYYENGNVKLEGQFKKGDFFNVWTEYKPDGTLWKQRTYDSEKYKLEEFDEDGNVIYTTHMWY
ncbi:toxin-antitoxin system YwqK family antitoxin [Gracilimonas sp. Q87]|uniref:toxin-antitoxin system YwqK family antitoxin n=1 Tax=Gracilimonas sp. Q87 TaxID=3384766 RepID=UPI003983FD24